MTIQDVFEAVGAHGAGTMSDAELCELEADACPGAGACGGQFTANTMAIACEFLGIAALGSGSVPANDPKKADVARAAGERVMALVRSGVRPRDIMTQAAFENAIASVATTGGSTNAVLHLLAIAREAGVDLALADFDRISARSAAAGGSQAVGTLRRDRPARRRRQRARGAAARRGGLDRRPTRRPSPAARSAQEAADGGRDAAARRSSGRPVRPLKKSGGLVILRGSLAPEGAVDEAVGHRARAASRAGARLRQRRSGVRGGPAADDQGRRRGRHPLRRAERRAGHARDAGRDRRDRGRRARR